MSREYLNENNLWDSTWLKEENPKLWAEREKHENPRATEHINMGKIK